MDSLVSIYPQSLRWSCCCLNLKKGDQNNLHRNHVRQKTTFPLSHFTLMTVVTALPQFLFSACFCKHCMLYFLFCTACVYAWFVILYVRARAVLQKCFFLHFCTQPKPIREPYVLHTGSKVLASEYLQEVLLLMLASKPVLVSAKRSDNGKFSKNTKTMTFMYLSPSRS